MEEAKIVLKGQALGLPKLSVALAYVEGDLRLLVELRITTDEVGLFFE